MLPTVSGDLSVLFLFIVITALSDRSYYHHPHITDEENEYQRGDAIRQYYNWVPAGLEQWQQTPQPSAHETLSAIAAYGF